MQQSSINLSSVSVSASVTSYTSSSGILLQVQMIEGQTYFPQQAHATDAGFDLFSNEDTVIQAGEQQKVHTGYRFVFPEGCYAQIYPRSGLGARGIDAFIGTIDQGYRGEIIVILRNLSKEPFEVKKGTKIAQLIIKRQEPCVIVPVQDVDVNATERGEKGFGSSGK